MAVYKLDEYSPELPEAGNYWIAPSATVAGRVRVGRDVGIWFGAALRGDDEALDVGDRTNVQDNAVLHADPGFPLMIGRGCTIGHGAIVHGCTIGDNTMVGMGSTIMNGARIGANCIIGANALVTEGKAFPDNSLIMGAPAKAVRELDPNAVSELERSAEAYVEKWRRYARGAERVAD
ncbi:MAG TPA: gamma carbonic anhydrase family protein [Amaricoccus sp.]|uniref:gamma carbonic anhydrase family protein n=1 Tax=Amaricoccus sp. TaxID=1872485 RepID=UPI002BBDF53C|nr:gamma carbonic anhydrase family protein [Amaricoccus sp.]HMQ92230.1 gamma carbonic anhydrase family protein [Amaricoccus sp.]HMR12207.1 gamma carbonic anhydrase family protein [Arachnia sp.]HMR51686.1 gamma carbonic anhydrase family protein [Amaricoccus sp.]HMT98378.1 gamma carbonic anhydrase family protein [Amaricoccus sp.]